MNWKFWKKKEKKCGGSVDYASLLKAMERLPPSTVLPPPKPALREPVLSMLEAMKDLSRWEEMRDLGTVGLVFFVRDKATDVEYQVFYSRHTRSYYLAGFDWMSTVENEAVTEGLLALKNALADKDKRAARQKMIELYCVSKEDEQC
jgi:hypothetical protein